jgi:hypothetical protein
LGKSVNMLSPARVAAILWSLILLSLMMGAPAMAAAQEPERTAAERQQIARQNAIEQELESVAIIDRKVMIPMRDGKRMAADIYRPKDQAKKYGTIFVRTPYDFNFWDISLGAPRDMSAELEAVKRGYAYVEINERGRFFSEGTWDILGRKSGNHRMLFHCGVAVGSDCPGKPGGCRVHSDGLRGRCGSSGSVFRTGQLVSRGRGTDALH